MFTNGGRTTCLLRGDPEVTGVGPSGMRRMLRPYRGGTYFGRLAAADMRPGASVYLDFATSSGCDGGLRRPVRFRSLVFLLPHGGRVRGGPVTISITCGLSMSEFGLPIRYADERERPGTPGTLHARLQLPAHARRGSTLRFAVVLSNPSGTPVVLRPCPGYTEGLFAVQPLVHRSFALNCDVTRTIGAHARVRYEMRLLVPTSAQAGTAKIGWNLNTPTGLFTGGVIEIIG